MENDQKRFFVIVGKRPMRGFSKTRLAKELDEERSFCLYDAFIKDFFKNLKLIKRECGFSRRNLGNIELFVTPSEKESLTYFEDLLTDLGLDNFRIRFQAEKKFFERLSFIFKEINLESEDSFIHLTGTDIPDFPFKFLKQDLFNDLKVNDVVIGPDDDGGFYYLGMNSKFYNLFEDIDTLVLGNNSVSQVLINQCKKIGLKVRLLEKWSDIDNLMDLRKCVKRGSKLNIENTLRVCKDKGINL